MIREKNLQSGLIKESSMTRDLAAASPPLAVTGMGFLGYPVTDWAALFSIVWVVILMALKIHELLKKNKCSKCNKD